jgi:hypothetical protein
MYEGLKAPGQHHWGLIRDEVPRDDESHIESIRNLAAKATKESRHRKKTDTDDTWPLMEKIFIIGHRYCASKICPLLTNML